MMSKTRECFKHWYLRTGSFLLAVSPLRMFTSVWPPSQSVQMHVRLIGDSKLVADLNKWSFKWQPSEPCLLANIIWDWIWHPVTLQSVDKGHKVHKVTVWAVLCGETPSGITPVSYWSCVQSMMAVFLMYAQTCSHTASVAASDATTHCLGFALDNDLWWCNVWGGIAQWLE